MWVVMVYMSRPPIYNRCVRNYYTPIKFTCKAIFPAFCDFTPKQYRALYLSRRGPGILIRFHFFGCF